MAETTAQSYELKVKPGEVLKSLNPLQQAKAEEIRDFWLNYVFSCEAKLKPEQATNGIHNLYRLAGYEAPQVIFVGSPAACQEVANHLTVVYKHLSNISETDFQQTIKEVTAKVKSHLAVAQEMFAEDPMHAIMNLEAMQVKETLPNEEAVTDAIIEDLKQKLGDIFTVTV